MIVLFHLIWRHAGCLFRVPSVLAKRLHCVIIKEWKHGKDEILKSTTSLRSNSCGSRYMQGNIISNQLGKLNQTVASVLHRGNINQGQR